ncbi:MAG: transglycosylase SLT domain-containing protein, partial [Bacteroidota bacterium]
MHYPPVRPGVRYLVIRLKTPDPRRLRLIFLVLACVSSGYWLGRQFTSNSQPHFPRALEKQPLFLLAEAAEWVGDTARFAARVEATAAALQVPPSWIMAVIYAESGFNPAIRNHRGSGATGLIQFMAFTAAELGYGLEEIAQM